MLPDVETIRHILTLALFGVVGVGCLGLLFLVLVLRHRAARRTRSQRLTRSVLRRWGTAAELRADPRAHEVATRAHGVAWSRAMIGAGLSRRVKDRRSFWKFAPAAWLPAARFWDEDTETLWLLPHVTTARPVAVGLLLRVAVIDGQGPAAFQARAEELAAHLRVPQVEIRTDDQDRADGTISIFARYLDPLRGMQARTEPLPWAGDWAALPVGLDEDGNTITMPLRDVSGTVVGGLPGGGKTASLSSMLAVLVPDERVQFAIFDGKGGADWEWIKPRAFLFNRDDENLAAVADDLESLVAQMRHRVQTMKEQRGGSSIWTTGGPSADLPLLVVVVDECQSFLDKGNISKGDKEAEAARARCEAAIASLVRKGRSAGVWVIVATQKPTTDSLPSTIGANASTAVAFRVKTSPSEIAIFGESPAEDEPSARDLPEAPGYAIIGTEDGGRVRVRFAYMPEAQLEALAWGSRDLARETETFDEGRKRAE